MRSLELCPAVVLAMVTLLSLSVSGCGPATAPPVSKEAADVIVATAQQRRVWLTHRAVGTVEPLTSVDVRSRVNGQIVAVGFEEGATVTAGQTLFRIDSRPLQIQLQAAEASLQRDAALLENARTLLEHNRNLHDKRFVSQEAWQQAETNFAALQATVAQDRTAIEAARLQLEYSIIKAPVSGRAGRIQVHVGNVVPADVGPVLVTLNQMDPVYVTFAIPQVQLEAVQRAGKGGSTVPVDASNSSSGGRRWQGRLRFVDNAVDKATGSVTLKALFDNSDFGLWPGAFVDVELQLGQIEEAVVIPAEAIQLGPKGHFVYVVDGDSRASMRTVSTGPENGGEVVVTQGVTVGERVVTDGHVKLTPGIAVKIAPPDRR